MELEGLKKLKDSNVHYSPAELESIFEIRTKRSLQYLNKNLFIDALLMIFTTIIMIAVTFIIGLQSRYLVSLEILGMAGILLIHYRVKYLLLNKIDFEKVGIKIALGKILHRLRLYFVSYYLIIPAMVVYLTNDLLSVNHPQQGQLEYWSILAIALVISILLTDTGIRLWYREHYRKIQRVYEALK